MTPFAAGLRSILIRVACVGLACSATAVPSSAESIYAPFSEPTARLASKVAALRVGEASAKNDLHALIEKVPAAFLAAVAKDQSELVAAWSLFLRGSRAQFFGPPGSDYSVAFHNPFLDATLFVRYFAESGLPLEVYVIPGEQVRLEAGEIAPVAAWVRSDAPFQKLVQQAFATRTRIAALTWREVVTLATDSAAKLGAHELQETAEVRLARLICDSELLAVPAHIRLIEECLTQRERTVRGTTESGISPARHLVYVAAAARDTTVAALSSSASPNTCVLVSLSGKDEPRLERLRFVALSPP